MLVHELKETETKLEEICEKIQIALTSLGDTDCLEQLEVWLDKLGEEALTTKNKAARYLDVCVNDSNSSVSSKGGLQGEMKKVGQGAKLKEGLDHGNTLLGPLRMFASRPFEADFHLESDKAEKSKPSYGEMRTENPGRKNMINWLNSAPDSEPNVNLWRYLDKIPLPKFSGEKTKYEDWKACFKVCVDSTNAPTIYKLVQLKSLLRGEAEELFEGLGWEDPDYECAWRILEREYGGEERFMSHQFAIIRDLKQVKSTEDFVSFARKLNSCVTTLENRERFEDLGMGMLYSMVKTKLPEKMLQDYYGWLENKYRSATLKSLCEWASQKSRHGITTEEDVKGINFMQQRKDANLDRMKLRKKKHSFAGIDEGDKERPVQVCQVWEKS